MTPSDADWVRWVVRAVLVAIGVILLLVIARGRKEGKHQRISLTFFVIGGTTLVLGVLLRLVSALSEARFEYDLFLIVAGTTITLVGLAIWRIREQRILARDDTE